MEIDQLRYFLKLAENRNFTRAAEELLISQPALSRSIQRLEEELGVPLVVRKSKALDLTDAGLLMKSRAEQIMAIIDDTKARITDDGESGRIRLGAIPTIAPYFLPPFLKRFAKDFPKAKVELHEDTTQNLLAGCSQGEIDLLILALPVVGKHLAVETLFTEELLLVLAENHPLLEKKQIRAADIETLPFVVLNEAHCLSDTISTYCRGRSFQPVTVGRTNQLSMVQELVALSESVSFVPEMAAKLDRAESRVYRSISGSKPTRTIAMIWDPYRFQSRLIQTMREKLKAEVLKR
ncbi:LysR family transcriptional regulator [Roseiconus lacunae]|uniref:LysR family transcriptional regulator n=1 Tax=Roseiconus lacunae TaxID=2605694 RepID=A0ABT7PMW9_9BACT|nr:LysR family transcriptional regulator [Roseiconus lacunae]MDM4017857.1 LysR family transcriptional regulator [Roseiconus lacunae]